MKLNAQDLKKIVNLTLEHYNQRAEEFWAGTRDHDVSQNIAAMLQYIEREPRFTYSTLAAGPARPQSGCRTRSHRGRLGRRRTFCRHGACLQRLRSLAAGFSQARSSEQLFRWCIRQRCAVSCTQPGVAARVVGTARKSETRWCAVQLKSARS